MKGFLVIASVIAGVALSAQAPDRIRPPQPGTVPALKLPAIQKRQLSNGLPVWMVELHEVPVAQVNLVVQSGSANDPAGKFGVTSLMMAMLEEGAGARSALEIADAVDFLGADLGTGSTFDASAVRLHVPVARLAEALPIMADVVLRPTFPEDELKRILQQRLTTLLQARDEPETILAQAFPRVLYGPTHRYGYAMIGTASTVAGFTTADLRAQYTAAFRPSNSALIVVGIVVISAVGLMLRYSLLGKRMRALSDDLDLAETAGIDTRRVIFYTWIFSGALAGLAGVMAGATTNLRPEMGFELLLPIFAAVILGGIGDAFGALAAGMVLGVMTEWSTLIIDARWKVAVGFVVLIVVLIIRPQGIFGKAKTV